MTELSVLALQNISLLRELNRHQRPASVPELAAAVERDVENVRKSLAKLEEAGLVIKADLTLTEGGLDQVRAIGRAEHGREEILPKGWTLLRHSQIRPDPDQPRQTWDPAADAELAASIGARGLLQNPVVWPAAEDGLHMLRAGERRWRAIRSLIASGEWPPERAILCQVRESEGVDALAEALVENLQRADLNPMDEAEAYLRLHDSGMSFAQIEREVGRRGKRSVEQYVFVARKAALEQKAEVRAGSLGINQLLKTLQDKKPETPALQLSERDGVALIELACAARWAPADPALGLEPGYTRLWIPPTGGPLNRLYDKKLIALRPHGSGHVYAKVLAASSLAGEWLKAQGFDDGPDICLHKARVKLLGDLQASAIPGPGSGPLRWVTPELNEPERDDRGGAAEAAPDPLYQEAVAEVVASRSGSVSGLQRRLQIAYNRAAALIERMEREGIVGPSDLRGFREVLAAPLDTAPSTAHPAPDLIRGQDPGQVSADAGPPSPDLAAQPPWTPASAGVSGAGEARAVDPIDPPELTTAERLVMIELAHKIANVGLRNNSGEPACRVGDWRDDALVSRLIIEHHLLKFQPGPGGRLVAGLTPSGLRWFADQPFSIDRDAEDGHGDLPDIRDLDLQEARDDAGRTDDAEALEAGEYLTPWLNDAVAEAAEPEPARMAFAPSPAPPPTHQSELGRAALRISAETRAMRLMNQACSACAELLSKGLSKRLDPADANQVLALIGNAQEAARPFLQDEAA